MCCNFLLLWRVELTYTNLMLLHQVYFLFRLNSVQCTGPSSLNLYSSTQLVTGQIIVTTNAPSKTILTHYCEPSAAAGKNTCLFLLFFLNFLAQLDQFLLLLFLKSVFSMKLTHSPGDSDCESRVKPTQWSPLCLLFLKQIIENDPFFGISSVKFGIWQSLNII